MIKFFCRDLNNIIKKHPDTWNLPCNLPRDLDCGEWITVKDTDIQIDNGLNIVKWKINNKTEYRSFNELYLDNSVLINGKSYINNFNLES